MDDESSENVHVNSEWEDDKVAGAPVVSIAKHSHPLSYCKQMFVDTQNDS